MIKVKNLLILSIFLLGLWSCGSETETKIPDYTILKEEKTPNRQTLRIILNDRILKEQVLAIATKEKQERGVEDLVCFFYINSWHGGAAWASASYLPQCNGCATDADVNGDSLQYNLIGLAKASADSLKALPFDSIQNKKLLGSYVDDVFQCKKSFYIVGNDSSEILLAQIFMTGNLFEKYKLKKQDSEKRYYSESGEDYLVYYPNIKKVNFFDVEQGKVYESQKLEQF